MVVKAIEEGDKVKAEIVTILYKEQIKNLKTEKLWPEGFEDQKVEEEIVSRGSEDSEDESDIFQNTNRPTHEESEEDDTDSEEEN